MQKVDEPALRKICNDPDSFVEQLKSESGVLGIKWDDLILNFEWKCEELAILGSNSLTDEHKACVVDVAKQNKFAFNKELVEQWASQSSAEADLQNLINSNYEKFVNLHI